MPGIHNGYFRTRLTPHNIRRMGSIAGKVVVVTGAARGQGAAEVGLLAAEGARVIATDVLDDQGQALVSGLPPSARPALYRHLDVASPADWEDLGALLRARYPVVHGLVNNAGIGARERLPHVQLATWQRTFDVNVTGALLGIQTLVPLMTEGGSIVNVCSVAALSGHVAAAYTASKWALRGLTRTASLELADRGIRANAIMPGLIDTPLMESASPAFTGAALAEIPAGRIGNPCDVAPLVAFLLSDQSSYISGAEIAVDGGMTGHVSHKRIADAIGAAAGTAATAADCGEGQ
jgi:NAD(P)-dependent dehydrogenase (short-subunit alcohol dehydrogenase family)